jgi:phosphohistidine phosphatase
MLTLTLQRHAKSSWDFPDLEDFLRPLNKRGYRQGAKLAQGFAQDVDVIWCSPAVRAYTTAQCILRGKPEFADKLCLIPEIYEAGSETLLDLLRCAGDEQHIVLIGHNPGFDLLASVLTGKSVTLKTAHIATMQLDCDSWQQIGQGCATLISLWRPE